MSIGKLVQDIMQDAQQEHQKTAELATLVTEAAQRPAFTNAVAVEMLKLAEMLSQDNKDVTIADVQNFVKVVN
jgi:hypothetical protein